MKSVLFKHRSIRKFRPTPIPEEVLRECLEAASRASTCGNMQLYSLVVTRDETLRERLAPCHVLELLAHHPRGGASLFLRLLPLDLFHSRHTHPSFLRPAIIRHGRPSPYDGPSARFG